MRSLAIGICSTCLLLAACQGASSESETPSQDSAQPEAWPDDIVSASGDITLPEDFETWPTLGSWSTAGPDGVANGMHQVYASPGTIETFRSTGEFPDGSVLVKEVRGANTAALTTGAASYATDEQVWFVMVKDSEGRFADDPLWGDGWGWALFEADDRTAQVAQNYELDCLSCHVPAQDTDWVYSEAYPVLRNSGDPVEPAWQDTP
ncbi:MAG: cytochrome P460 family protein [Pseudomonadota bacterium]